MRTSSKAILLVFMIASNCVLANETLPSEATSLLEESLDGLPASEESAEAEADAMRLKAVSVEAFSWGIQEGAYYRNNEIQSLLNENSFILNKSVTLSKFLIDGKMLMPTVLEAERIYVKNNDREARSVNMSYTLDKSPRIVSQAPTWRDYLVRVMDKPRLPIANAYPRNNAERSIWEKEFKRGWLKGEKQADSIFSSDLNKMLKDVTGLYRFRNLLAQNIVSLPKLIKNKSSVMLLDSGKTINLNDVKYRIQVDARFNKVTEWKPVFNKGSAHE